MNRINLEVKPYLLPMPVLIIATYNNDNSANAMNAAWGMISDYNEISISLSKHKTTDNFLRTKAFTVSIATQNYVTSCDYVGIESGQNVPDKFDRAGFHSTKSAFVNAPIINELPMALECKVKSFENGILVGEIVNISVNESVLTEGKIDYKKLKPICYDPCTNSYLSLGEVVGRAFHDGLALKK